MPAGGLLTPEAGVPDENFFLDGAEHDEDETESGELGEDSEGDAQAAGDFGDAEEDGEGLGHPDAFGAGGGIFKVGVAAGDKDESDHEAQQQEAEVGEAG